MSVQGGGGGPFFEVSCYPSCMNTPTESLLQQPPEASSHVATRPADMRRIHTVVIRVSAEERAALKERCPDADLSTWMRAMCLGLPAPEATKTYRQTPVPPPPPDEATLLQARALMSLAQATSDALGGTKTGCGPELREVLNAAVIKLTEELP